MLDDHNAYKYETTYKGPFVIMPFWNNGTVTLQCGVIKSRYNIHHIKPHTSDTRVEDINPETNV